ncbi:MAG: GNAT family N-acetyltransferase [Candidatus Sumerlaeia bacterium]|nr:GNAT family N-acetyltransferase [Candidatus Sumerlaeia bacterium]
MTERLRGEIHRPRGGEPDGRWLAALWRLERRCYPPGLAYSPEMLAGWLSDSATLTLGLWSGDLLIAAQISELGTGHLITLDVDPRFQRRGLGRRLLRITLHLLRRWGGHRRTLCEIGAKNQASLALHRAEGFSIIGLLPGYYPNGEDALLLTRPLGRV